MTKSRTVFVNRAYHNSVKLWEGLLTAAFIFYILSVLYLVLGERLLMGSSSRFHQVTANVDYWTQVKRHIQPIPFRTIMRYARRLPKSNPLRRIAFVNLVGNLALFFPMGLFLPYFRRKQRKFIRFSITLILMILFVEVTQVLSLLGACDVDDLILNYIGAVFGFLSFRILYFIGRKIHGKSEN